MPGAVLVVGLGVIGPGAAWDVVVRLGPTVGFLAAILVFGLCADAGVLANVVNNIPATLALLPVVSGSPIAVLAVLIGVNVGPSLTYVGSLATLLWRRLLPAADKPRTGEFHLLGLLSTPPLVALAVLALWASATVLA